MKNKLIFLSVFMLLFSLSACNLFFEERLDKESITLLAPADSTRSEVFLTTFWWEELEGADFYTLQVVKPGFATPQQLIVDSAVNGLTYEIQLTPGTYQWRVRAENASYSTEFETRTLFIDTVSDISNQIIDLISPPDQFFSNTLSVTLNWTDLSIVNEYRVRVAQPDIASGNFVYDFTWQQDSVNIQLDEGNYEWQVRGEKDLSNTIYSTRSLVIDTTQPTAPTLLSPADNATVQDTVDFSWNSESNLLRDTLEIATDTNFNTIFLKAGNENESFQATSLNTGITYYWRVKSIDRALNNSNYSDSRSFSTQ
jgi:hypothetical protein